MPKKKTAKKVVKKVPIKSDGPGKGKKVCVNCGQLVGARTKECPKCHRPLLGQRQAQSKAKAATTQADRLTTMERVAEVLSKFSDTDTTQATTNAIEVFKGIQELGGIKAFEQAVADYEAGAKAFEATQGKKSFSEFLKQLHGKTPF